MGVSGISESQVSRLCEGIDRRAKAFLDRPIEGDWPYLWTDATYLKIHQAGCIVSVAVIVAVKRTTKITKEKSGLSPALPDRFVWTVTRNGNPYRAVPSRKWSCRHSRDR